MAGVSQNNQSDTKKYVALGAGAILAALAGWRFRHLLQARRISPQKSPEDDRLYRVIKLKNNMQVLSLSHTLIK